MAVLYFAYGSNMNGARMSRRVPTARHYGTATLYGWRLAERLYADIERWRGGKVRGVVYALDVRGLMTLDGYEGFPNVYMRNDVRVKMDGGGRWVSAWTYFMTDTTRRRRAGVKFPSDYAAACAAGAAENGLPTDFFNRRILCIDAEIKTDRLLYRKTPTWDFNQNRNQTKRKDTMGEENTKPAFRMGETYAARSIGDKNIIYAATATRRTVRVAVYGTLMRGERNAHWAEEAGARVLGEGTVDGDLHDTGWGYPTIADVGRNGGNGVAVEVLETDDDGLAHMDVLEGCPNLYRREKARVFFGSRAVAVDAWIYAMNRIPPTARLIEPVDGVADWREYRKARKENKDETSNEG